MENITLQRYLKISEEEGILKCAVSKRLSVDEFREMIIDLKQIAMEKKINKILIDALSVDFRDLTISERHDIGLAGAEILKSDVRAVVLVKNEFINKHGENVANNRGADVFVTDNMEEATQWLLR